MIAWTRASARRAFWRLWAIALVGLLAWVLSAAVGCSPDKTAPARPACSCDPAPVVDPALLAFLSKARASHHQADLAEQAAKPERAVAVLERLVGGPIPGGVSPSAEVREVLADTYGRLGELRSRAGQHEAAMADVGRGLELAREPTHFRGRLWEIRGLVEERWAAELERQGRSDEAGQARERAIESFEKAIAIGDEVIRRALADGGAAPR